MTKAHISDTPSTGKSIEAYHTNPDCRNASENTREATVEYAKSLGLRLCTVCSGEVDTTRNDNFRPLRTRIEQGEVDV